MQAWLNYFIPVFAASVPYLIIILPMMFMVIRMAKRTRRNQAELIELQRETVALLKESIRNQRTIIEKRD